MRLSIESLRKQLALIGVRKDTVAARAVKELIEYKEIEKDLGIDLITLFKALKGGIFVDGDSTRKYVFLDVDEKELFTINDFECTYFAASLSQYGKMWALAKEELE